MKLAPEVIELLNSSPEKDVVSNISGDLPQDEPVHLDMLSADELFPDMTSSPYDYRTSSEISKSFSEAEADLTNAAILRATEDPMSLKYLAGEITWQEVGQDLLGAQDPIEATLKALALPARSFERAFSYVVGRTMSNSVLDEANKEIVTQDENFKAFTQKNQTERLNMIRDEKRANWEEEFRDVPGSNMAGTFLRGAATPTLLLPAGQTIKAAMGIGAAVGAIDSALYQTVETGEIDGASLLLVMGLGAGAGAVITKASSMFSRNITAGKAGDALESSTDDIGDALIAAGISPQQLGQGTLEEITEAVNKTFKINTDISVDSQLLLSKALAKGAPKESASYTKMRLDVMLDSDKLTAVQRKELRTARYMTHRLEKIDLEISKKMKKDPINGGEIEMTAVSAWGDTITTHIPKKLAQTTKLYVRSEARREKIALRKTLELDKKEYKRAFKFLEKETKEIHAIMRTEAIQAHKLELKLLRDKATELNATLTQKVNTKTSLKNRARLKAKRQKVIDEWSEYNAKIVRKEKESVLENISSGKRELINLQKEYDEALRYIEETTSSAIKRIDGRSINVTSTTIKYGGEKYSPKMQPLDLKIDEAAKNSLNRQKKEFLDELDDVFPRDDLGRLDDVAIANFNSHYTPGESGGMNRQEAVISGARGKTQYTEEYPVYFVGEKGEDIERGWVANLLRGAESYQWIQDPSYYLRMLGYPGKKLAAMMERTSEEINMILQARTTEMLNTMTKHGIKQGSPEEKAITAVMRGIKSIDTLTPAQKAVHTVMRRQYTDSVKAAYDGGVISKARYTELLADKDYFPHVFKKDLLDSKEGHEAFVTAVSSKGFASEASAEIALKTLLGDSFKFLKVRGIAKNKTTGEYHITRDAADRFNKTRDTAFSGKSSHLEYDRKLIGMEKELAPFLEDNLIGVTEKYLDSVYKRVVRAKMFGLNGERAARLTNEIDQLEKGQGQVAREIYLTGVDSTESKALARSLAKPGQGKLINNLTALESFNLILAQIANITQATFNGMLLLANMAGSNPAIAAKVFLKAPKYFFSKMGRERATRSAAAMQSVLMQIQGELGTTSSKMVTGFLKYTGFTFIEKQQRMLGAALGRAYAEELSSNMAKVLNKIETQGPGKALIAQKKALQKQLAEMGLNPEATFSKISKKMLAYDEPEIDRAAQWFSNNVNFVADKTHKPLLWNHPYAKLFTQFKSYVMWQTGFINRNVMKPLRNGNPLPLLALVAASPMGIPRDMLSHWVKGDLEEQEYDLIGGFLAGIMSLGGLGVWGDLARSSGRGEDSIISTLVKGPIMGDGLGITIALKNDTLASFDRGEFVLTSSTKELLETIIPGAFGRPLTEAIIHGETPQFVEDTVDIFN